LYRTGKKEKVWENMRFLRSKHTPNQNQFFGYLWIFNSSFDLVMHNAHQDILINFDNVKNIQVSIRLTSRT